MVVGLIVRAPSPPPSLPHQGGGAPSGVGASSCSYPSSLPGSSRQSTPPLALNSLMDHRTTLSPCGRGTAFLRSAEKQGEGLRAVPQGKSPQWGDLRREGHESYARMARSRPCFNACKAASSARSLPSGATRPGGGAPSPARGEGRSGGCGLIVRAPSPPPSLPHQGGGVVRCPWHHLAPSAERHLPLDGGGWEGVEPHPPASRRPPPITPLFPPRLLPSAPAAAIFG